MRGIRQHSLPGIIAVWAAAALPMAALAWLVAPALAEAHAADVTWFKTLALAMTMGLVWQTFLVMGLVYTEQGTLRWRAVRRALWLQAPQSPTGQGRARARVWWLLLPLTLGFAAEALLPGLVGPAARDLGAFVASDVGQDFWHGNWAWFAVLLVMVVCNTVVGEELLFRGWLLPRMRGVFGRGDWVANGVAFATYHLHMPWAIPYALLDMFWLSWPSRRYRSAWFGIIVHSMQSLTILIVVGLLVLKPA